MLLPIKLKDLFSQVGQIGQFQPSLAKALEGKGALYSEYCGVGRELEGEIKFNGAPEVSGICPVCF